MTDDIGSRARIPNPALEPLGRLVGNWRTTGTHPGLAGVTVHGRASFAWQDGGAFLVWRTEIDDDPRFPAGISIFGSDDAAESWFVIYFDERGISRKYDVTLEADGFTMQRLDPKFSQRMTFPIEADGNRIVTNGQMSREGGDWEADLSSIYDRV
jgi:hypothetical protein